KPVSQPAMAKAAIKPDTMVIRLQLMDARTQKTLDNALLEARMGALMAEKGYQHFIQQTLSVYLNSVNPGGYST
nr:hypothetical protein [Cellvibrionaceae bacterium]